MNLFQMMCFLKFTWRKCCVYEVMFFFKRTSATLAFWSPKPGENLIYKNWAWLVKSNATDIFKQLVYFTYHGSKLHFYIGFIDHRLEIQHRGEAETGKILTSQWGQRSQKTFETMVRDVSNFCKYYTSCQAEICSQKSNWDTSPTWSHILIMSTQVMPVFCPLYKKSIHIMQTHTPWTHTHNEKPHHSFDIRVLYGETHKKRYVFGFKAVF